MFSSFHRRLGPGGFALVDVPANKKRWKECCCLPIQLRRGGGRGRQQRLNLGNTALDDGSLGGSSDLFIAKFSTATGTPNSCTLTHSRYFGGNGDDYTDPFTLADNVGSFCPGNCVDVDASGNIFVTGTAGTGFPVTWAGTPPAWYFSTFSGVSDAFVAALAPNFKNDYCTYLGSSNEDHGSGIAVYNASSGYYAYMAGRTKNISSNYPTAKETPLSYYHNAYQGGDYDGVISKIIITGSIVGTQAPNLPATAISISPNPCVDFMFVDIDAQYLITQGVVSIYDLSGRQVQQSTLSVGQNRLLIDTKYLVPGAHVVRISLPSGTWSGKFVKSVK